MKVFKEVKAGTAVNMWKVKINMGLFFIPEAY